MNAVEQDGDLGHDEEHFHQSPDPNRPHSIDMSMELERQLEDEPLSPLSPTASKRPVSLDPHVLSAIVTNLRQALVEVSRDKDELVDSLAEAHAREAELKEALSIMSERSSSLETENEELKKKSQGDDEAISMLRSKVEESRRGLMRLQTESRRMSQVSNLSLDMSKSNPAFFMGANPPPSSSKRASFAPLTGSPRGGIRGHRRISSVSDYASHVYDEQTGELSMTSPSQSAFLSEDMRIAESNRRSSGIFGLRIPSPPNSLPETPGINPAQLDALKRELAATKTELEQARHDVAEAYEAKEASEQCVDALRTFITEHVIGESKDSTSNGAGARSTSAPADPKVQAAEPKKAAGWSALKLWRVDIAPTSRPSAPAADSPASDTTQQGSPAIVPLSKKLGDFFSSRSSFSSETPSTKRDVHAYNHQEPMLNGSDTDSDHEPEPVSPTILPLHRNILVREISSVSSTSGVTSSLEPVPEKSPMTPDDATEAESVNVQ